MKSAIFTIILFIAIVPLSFSTAEEELRKGWQDLLKEGLTEDGELNGELVSLLESDLETFAKEANQIRRLDSEEDASKIYEACVAAIASRAANNPLPTLKALADSGFRDSDLQNLAHIASDAIVRSNPRQLLGLLSDAPGGEGADFKMDKLVAKEMMVAVFRREPTMALSWISETPGRVSLLELDDHSVLESVIELSPISILKLARDHEEVRFHGLTQAFASLAKQDLEAANSELTYWKSKEDGLHQERIIAMAVALAKVDKAKALRWSKSLGDDGISAWYNLKALEDPEATAQEVIERTDLSDAAKSRLALDVVNRWADQSPVKASAFLDTLAEKGIYNSHAHSHVMTEWLASDREAASTWLSKIKHDGTRDACINTMVGMIVGDDPERAFMWALQLSSQQESTLQMAFHLWHGRDSAAAVDALQNSKLPDELKKKILPKQLRRSDASTGRLQRRLNQVPDLEARLEKYGLKGMLDKDAAEDGPRQQPRP